MIAIPAGFDMALVVSDLFTMATPIIELAIIGLIANVVHSALMSGRRASK